MKILHIINSLGNGGAEATLAKICKYDRLNEHRVITLMDGGKHLLVLKKLNINVTCLNIKVYTFFKIFALIKLIRSYKPDIVQTWLIHSDLIGGIAAKLCGLKKIIWNIRYSELKLGKSKLSSIIIVKILSYLSYFIPISIIVVSEKAKKIYKNRGYDYNKFKFIPNGYDLSLIKPSNFLRQKFRNKIKVKKNTLIIGNVARYDPKKDHANLIRALHLIKLKNYEFVCVLAGPNVTKNNIVLNSLIRDLGLSRQVKLLGQITNVSQIMNGIDLYVQSSSFGEGFPNVVAEAMCCGTPCVVTDVGDASNIVKQIGWVAPPDNHNKLAKEIEKAFVKINKKKLSRSYSKERLRIKNYYSIDKMINKYDNLWSEVNKN